MKKVTFPANEMGDYIYNEFGHPIELTPNLHLGFTIGNGKKMWWYFLWHTTSGNCTVCDDLGNRRYINGDQIITVHFKELS